MAASACSGDDSGSVAPDEPDLRETPDAGEPEGGTAGGAAPGEPIHLTRLAQIGIVVEDADAASARFAEMLGIGPWTIVEQEGTSEGGSAFAARVAYAYVGDLELELVQVTNGETPQTEFLHDHGEGLYDLGFFVDNVDGAVAQLTSSGATVLLEEPGEWAYVDSPAAGGTIFKLTKTRERMVIDSSAFEPPEDSIRPAVIDHVGAWVVDVNVVTSLWQTEFGVGSWNIFPYTITTSDGDSVSTTLAFTAALGVTEIELVQVFSGAVPAELRRGNGRGLWEVAIEVADPAAEATKLVDRGARLIVQTEDGGTAVVDIGAGGVAFELVTPQE